jgi:magnesium-transporting ATPase (P-type)
LKQQNPPEDMTRYDEKLNKLLRYANVVVPLIDAGLLLNANLQNPPSILWNNVSVAGLFCVGLLQLISVVYLFYAILKIRNHLSVQSPKQLNIKMLVINLLAFSLYLVSLIVYYVFYLILYSEVDSTVQQ